MKKHGKFLHKHCEHCKHTCGDCHISYCCVCGKEWSHWWGTERIRKPYYPWNDPFKPWMQEIMDGTNAIEKGMKLCVLLKALALNSLNLEVPLISSFLLNQNVRTLNTY